MIDAFWRDPPWRGGKGGYRMGLRPIGINHWLPEQITPDERARKQRLLADPGKLVFAAADDSVCAQNLLLDAVSKATPSRPDRDTRLAPLARAALLVPDDLCLMQHRAGAYQLTAACVCSPSYWRLAEKIGRTLEGIHAPVPTLNGKLGTTMVQFFNRLPADTVFERRNWLIHLDAEPFHAQSEAWPDLSTSDASQLIVRSERQTLRRLAIDTVAFTIRVTCHPLAEIVGYPESMTDLLLAFDAMDADERNATGHVHYGEAVSAFLQSSLARLHT
jgi:hypothetical protein